MKFAVSFLSRSITLIDVPINEYFQLFSESPPVIECSIISYTRLWDDVTWKEVGLKAPGAQKTTNFISRMR